MFEETFVALIATSCAVQILAWELPSLMRVLTVTLLLACIVKVEFAQFSRQVN